MVDLEIRPLGAGDRDWVRRVTTEHWGAPTVVVHGVEYLPQRLPGFAAVADAARAGVLTFEIGDRGLEIVTLVSLRERTGVGSALLSAAVGLARDRAAGRVWLVTTNDNLRALGFYQKRGFRLVGISPGAVAASRRIKPEIPRLGEGGIPIRDEIELELGMEDES